MTKILAWAVKLSLTMIFVSAPVVLASVLGWALSDCAVAWTVALVASGAVCFSGLCLLIGAFVGGLWTLDL